MSLSALAACDAKDSADESNVAESKAEESKAEESKAEESKAEDSKAEDEDEKVSFAGLKAEKLGTLDISNITTTKGGVFYKDGEKYGIISADGKSDTGAKYAYVKANDMYFNVMDALPAEGAPASALNCVGLVDANGKELIPKQYASISILNERYARACTIIKETNNKDEALVYGHEGFSLSPTDGDTLYTGRWCVYDLTTGKPLDGVTGTKAYRVSAYGECVAYITDYESRVVINSKGEKLPDDAYTNIFSNGYYRLSESNGGAVYAPDNKKVFEYKNDGFYPISPEGDYIKASKNENGEVKYAFMDLTGKVVSGEFDGSPTIYGKFVFADGKLYDFNGKSIIDGTFETVYMDARTEGLWLLKDKDKNCTIIDEKGTVLLKEKSGDTYSLSSNSTGFDISKKVDSGSMYYSFKDKDFTINGFPLRAWLITTPSVNGLRDVVDSISGETIISGYKSYESVVADDCIYIYAKGEDGTYQVYKVK